MPLDWNPAVDVQHYDLTLAIDPVRASIDAQVKIDVLHPDTLGVLELSFGKLAVGNIRVNGQPVEARREPGRLLVSLTQHEGQHGRQRSQIEISYRGKPQTGLYRERHGSQHVLFTDSWPDRGRGWLPAVYHPADPATWTLAMTIPRSYEAVASGRLLALDTLAAGIRYQWVLDASAPTYTFAFAIADFSVARFVAADSIPVSHYMLAADSAQSVRLNRSLNALAYFSELLGPYAYTEYASVEVPLQYAGMENAAASFLQAALFESGSDVEAVAIHEIAHQWFGNRVVPADWQHLWLSEGVATYLTTLFIEHIDGLDAARLRWRTLAELTPQQQRSPQPLVPVSGAHPESYLSWVPYQKGASVLHLLRLKLGDETFFRVLRQIYGDYAGFPLSTSLFKDVLEQEGGIDLDGFFEYWVYGKRLPKLTSSWDATERELSWRIVHDEETLAGIPFELAITHGSETRYVNALVGQIKLESARRRPDIKPVGVYLELVENS